MKRCPECRRDYYDDSLLYCLDDGVMLLEGPATAEGDEPATAILGRSDPTDRSDGFSRPAVESIHSRRAYYLTSLVIVVLALSTLAVLFGGRVFSYLFRAGPRQIDSLAVMPFVNDSGNADVEYLSDGMTETLISSLSQVRNLNVKASSSVFRYKGKATDARSIGKELSVQAILSGRVVQRGDEIRLRLELIDAETENVIWSDKYDKKVSDLISLQDEIARDVSNKLRLRLSGADEQQLAKNYPTNTDAYRLYLLGRFHWNKRTTSDFRKAIDFFQQAISADPNYALAYAGLADAYMLNSEYGGELPKEAIPKARDTALKALSLDEQLSEAHTALGVILWNDYDFSGAEREYKRAIELDSNHATAHQRYGLFLTEFGKYDDGLAEVERALEIEPFSLPINRSKGDILFYAHRYDESIAQLNKTVALDANWATAYRVLSQVYWAKGDHAKSVEQFGKYREVQGRQNDAALERESFTRGGWQAFLRMRIKENQDSGTGPGSSFIVATFYAALGQKNEAFTALNKAYEDHENGVLLLKVHPLLDPLRGDPRFQELLKKVGFPD